MKNHTVCIHMLDYLLRYAVQEGVDRELLCAESSLDPALLDDPDARISAAMFIRIWQRICSTLKDDRFGLNLGRSLQHFPFSHIVVSVMLNSRDLMAAFENLTRYHNLMSDIGRPALLSDPDRLICFATELQAEAPLDDLQFPVFIFSMVLSLLRYLGNDPYLHPVSVDFYGSGVRSGLEEFFRAEIAYQCPVRRESQTYGISPVSKDSSRQGVIREIWDEFTLDPRGKSYGVIRALFDTRSRCDTLIEKYFDVPDMNKAWDLVRRPVFFI